VVFDVGVGAHERVEVDGVAGLVGVVAPSSGTRWRGQGLLPARAQQFAAHDQPGPLRPVRQVDQVGELRVPSAPTRLSEQLLTGMRPTNRRAGSVPSRSTPECQATVALAMSLSFPSNGSATVKRDDRRAEPNATSMMFTPSSRSRRLMRW
jgi:hypothetical protein